MHWRHTSGLSLCHHRAQAFQCSTREPQAGLVAINTVTKYICAYVEVSHLRPLSKVAVVAVVAAAAAADTAFPAPKSGRDGRLEGA